MNLTNKLYNLRRYRTLFDNFLFRVILFLKKSFNCPNFKIKFKVLQMTFDGYAPYAEFVVLSRIKKYSVEISFI